MLSYFGCDQSQVQRYLTAKSIDEGRTSLLMSAYWKIPLQVLVLFVGVFTFIYYTFHTPPMLFNAVHERDVQASARSAEFQALDAQFRNAHEARRQAAMRLAAADDASGEAARAYREEDTRLKATRTAAIAVVRETTRDKSYDDVNYVFPTFITTALPIGLIGLWIVAIITAATDSIAAELNSLAAVTVMDFYRRYVRREAPDQHYVLIAKVATAFWGLFAGMVAIYASTLGSLIEVVNQFGSYFYGSILGVFLLAFFVRAANGTGAFVGLIAGMGAVRLVAVTRPDISFLWHNVIGAVVVVVIGRVVSTVAGAKRA